MHRPKCAHLSRTSDSRQWICQAKDFRTIWWTVSCRRDLAESTRVETGQASDSTLLRTVASSIDLNLPLRNERETLLRIETISSTQGWGSYFNKMLSKTKRTRSCSSKRSDSQPWVETLVAGVQIKSRVRKAKAHLAFQWTLKTVAWVLSNRSIARQEVARTNPQHKMTTWMG